MIFRNLGDHEYILTPRIDPSIGTSSHNRGALSLIPILEQVHITGELPVCFNNIQKHDIHFKKDILVLGVFRSVMNIRAT